MDKAAGSVVRLKTEKGDITLELFDDKVPITAGSFLELARRGFYDGLTFHRVEPGFVIQGGDPDGNGTGGPGFTIPDENVPGLKHVRGTLSMAKKPFPDSAGSQFFIVTGEASFLDGKYAAFGRVLDGMSVVDSIRVGDRMDSVEIVSESPAAESAVEQALKARKPE